ncbi:MAG: glycoside hydrolase family 3 C-terminal domain-containing protein [Anaerolineales bacterium]|nr:glycoside hydrolase family 3 C-terminal domain-containing protein [Anaerolineales bacterium]
MKQIPDLISKMTLEEKAALCSGLDFWHTKSIERLGIPSIMLTDGPHGLRKEVGDSGQIGLAKSVPATCFPTASALAATWNRELICRVGEALGEECRQEKVGVILGPGVNIKRSPLCGRNFEYFSEDPHLTGEIAKSYIRGVQGQGIGTSLKHYAVNNQEYRRMTINAVVDQRALHEIYLRGFEIAVQGAQPWTVMGAYNRVNGTYCCEHTYLVSETLRENWGYEGFCVSDWGALNEKVLALKAGLDLEMPGTDNGNDQILVDAVQSGQLDEDVLNRAVGRILEVVFRAEKTLAEDYTSDQEAHHALAREAAGEGAVLLKNEARTLPLEKGIRVALLGAFAKSPRYQGAGSSIINPSRLDTLYGEMVKIAGEEMITYAPGYPLKANKVDEDLIQQAVETAEKADTVVINVGLPDIFEVEGLDREHLRLPESHNRLIAAVTPACERVIGVLSNGSPVEMPWVDDVQAVLEGYLGGQAGAGGVADLLYGIVNPSGKLAETFPLRLEDTPAYHQFPGGPRTVEYRESLYVGYRFYDTVEKEVLFPFGHGLSYTTFAYSDLVLSQSRINLQEPLIVSAQVANTGSRAGKEVVQLYIAPEAPTAFRPRGELKGFEKISLQPGEKKEVSFTLDERAFAFYHTGSEDWQVESGLYRILLGSSSRDIRLQGEVQVESSSGFLPIPERDRLPAYVDFPADGRITSSDFEQLIGKPLPPQNYEEGEEYTLNTPITDMKNSFIGRQLGKSIRKQVQQTTAEAPESPNARMIEAVVEEAPLRTLMMFDDRLNRGMITGLLRMINGKFFPGLLLLLRNAVRGSGS